MHTASPWAWTPTAVEVAQDFGDALKHQPPTWKDQDALLYRKSWSTQRLSKLLADCKSNDGQPLEFLCGPEVLGEVVQSVQEFETAKAIFAGRGFGHLILKPDLSASGRGQRRYAVDGRLKDRELAELNQFFAVTGRAVVEPELDRLMDFSILWDGDGNLLDWSQQLIGPGRRYLGSVLGKSLLGCDGEVKRFFLADKAEKVKQVSNWLHDRLAQSEDCRTLSGPFGVDAMVYRNLEGELKIKPLVELNPRTTMGHVSLALRKRLASGAVGQFRIFSVQQWRTVWPSLKSLPLLRSREGHWKSGVDSTGRC